MYGNGGYQFFVAVRNGVRTPVRADRRKANGDRRALGIGARVVPLLWRQARELIMADRQFEKAIRA
jgi:hypothetical protein